MQIIEKDISWLVERIPDFMEFYKEHKPLFEKGFLAGGFLRRAYNSGSIHAVLDYYSKGNLGDVDFFFYDNSDVEKGAMYLFNKFGYEKPSFPNSYAAFAYEVRSPWKKNKNPCGEISLFYQTIDKMMTVLPRAGYGNVKYQLISRWVGPPEKTLNRFDISNCKIATDGKKVYMVEDWEELEKAKIIRVDNFAGKYIFSRLGKYLASDYTLFEQNRQELLEKMLVACKEVPHKVRSFIYQHDGAQNLFDSESISIFYGLLGEISKDEKDGEYIYGSLSETEDFALHMMKRKAEKEAENAAKAGSSV